MNFTEEQNEIVRSAGDIKINAVAGSGKTTTIIHYAANQPANARILYLAYNKSVRLEARKRFAEQGLSNVQVETAHSLAYKNIVFRKNYKVAQSGYKTYEIAELLGLKGNGEKHQEYIIANHISRYLNYFCNSDVNKVQDLNYLSIVEDEKAKTFVRNYYQPIEMYTRQLLAKMFNGETDVTHDFYLKMFQLEKPVLSFDYILFDEGQDASPAMLDIFLNQDCIKLIVGDSHQQIYSWRHAVNSLQKTGFAELFLSTSFRFPQDIADLAMQILNWKENLGNFKPVNIIGKGQSGKLKSKATIARTNLGLLLKAITFISENKSVRYIYFEGNIHSYTYADDGASLYDVLNLYNGQHDKIRDRLIKVMRTMKELKEYIEKTEDSQLAMMVQIVEEYGNEIPYLIQSLKNKHVGDNEKGKAEMIFSTVHRSKGMEYDEVQLADDFTTEGRLKKIKSEIELGKDVNLVKWNEEVNLLYVAITRAKHRLLIPATMLPENFPATQNIKPVLEREKNVLIQKQDTVSPGRSRKPDRTRYSKELSGKAYNYSEQRLENKNANMPWTEASETELVNMFDRGIDFKDIALHFGRNKGAIITRLRKLGCFNSE